MVKSNHKVRDKNVYEKDQIIRKTTENQKGGPSYEKSIICRS